MHRIQALSEHFGAEGGLDTQTLFSQVLLIEDEPAHAKLISRALKTVVGEIEHVSTGEAALRSLESSFSELVLCDLNLPDMSGIAIIREIVKARPGLPIIVLTSSSSPDDAVQAMREGAWDFMVKQFEGDLRGQMSLIINRTAERKLLQLREYEVRAERDAYWVAAFTAQDGLAILGERGSVVFANSAFETVCTLIDPRLDEIRQLNIVDLLARENYTAARDLHRELGDGAQVGGDALWNTEIEIKKPPEEGGSRFYDITVSTVTSGPQSDIAALPDAFSRMRYHVLWARDITRRKEGERFQRDLLSTTTHDLKGPLGAILTSAELLSETDFQTDEKALRLLTRISSCARNSISIIDELLSARRIQDGVLSVRPREYSAEDFLEDVVLDYFPMAKAKGIELTFSPVEKSLQVYADKLGLTRVLGNLVSNAIKYTQRNGKVELFAEKIPGAVAISVSDNGPGIDADARHSLFERFTRLEKHQDVEGSGIGLFVTKNIVDAHQGNIDLRSKLGIGTTFVISLPDKAPSAVATEQNVSASQEKEPS